MDITPIAAASGFDFFQMQEENGMLSYVDNDKLRVNIYLSKMTVVVQKTGEAPIVYKRASLDKLDEIFKKLNFDKAQQ